MLNKLYTDIFVNIKKKLFDDFIIYVANKCIDYITQSDIKILNNKVDGSPLSVADLKKMAQQADKKAASDAAKDVKITYKIINIAAFDDVMEVADRIKVIEREVEVAKSDED